MRVKPDGCNGCPMERVGLSFCIPEGKGSSGVALVGEASGRSEARDGLPFRPYGESGALLEKVFKVLKQPRDAFRLLNVISCQPPGNDLKAFRQADAAIEHCSRYLRSRLEHFQPKVTVALGATALRALAGVEGITQHRGYVFNTRYGYVVGALHPAYIRRGKSQLLPTLVYDIQKALRISYGQYIEFDGHPGYKRPDYVVHPSLDDAYSFRNRVRDNPGMLLTYDIENPESGEAEETDREDLDPYQALVQIQFSLGMREGIAFPWEEPYIGIAKEILSYQNMKLGHNCFHRNTQVWMADGTWKPIWHVKVGELVNSLERGRLVAKKVTGRMLTNDERSWVEVRIDGMRKGGSVYDNKGVVCTPDHEWILNDGTRVQAKDLKAGQLVPLPFKGSNKAILGCAMGDGHLSITQNSLRLAHTNEKWLRAKANHFGVNVRARAVISDFTAEGAIEWSCNVQVPSVWRRRLYGDTGKKWVAPCMESLAILYGDDGCLSGHECPTIAIHKFKHSQVEFDKCIAWFAKTFGKVAVHNGGVLYIWKAYADAFFEAIAPYLHPSMAYKLPARFRGRYNGWMEVPTVRVGIVTSVGEIDMGNTHPTRKYCLEVEDTHTFFTRAGLVSNCWLYDNPVLKALHDIRPEGVIHDSLAMFHHMYPDLEAGLQKAASLFDFPFPWKHLAGEDLAWYGCADVDSPHWIWDKLPGQMKARGIWDGYLKYVAGFYPILVRAQDRGVGIDPVYREEFKTLLEQKREETDKELQEAIPVGLKNPHPKLGYKKEPREVTEAAERWRFFRAQFEAEGKQMITPLADYIYRKTGMELREFEVKEEELGRNERSTYNGSIAGEGVTGTAGTSDASTGPSGGSGEGVPGTDKGVVKVRRWCKVKPFSARSSPQVVKYIKYAAARDVVGKKRSKHQVPLTLKEKKETTAKEELERLYFNTGDPVYKLIVEFREYAKILSTDLPQWEPSSRTGRVHTSFTMAPASGQLSSRNPNIQNVIKHTKTESFRFKRELELGKAFRKMIVAAPGRVLMEFDKSAFHVVMLGREAGSPNYMRIAKADMHSFFASHLIGRHNKAVRPIDPNLDYEELKEQCRWIKKNFKGVRDTKAKPTILGVGLGLGANKLWHTNRENIESPSEAKDLLAMLRELFPEVFAFQDRVRKEAYERGVLVSPWGFCRTFYDVYTKKKDRGGKWKLVPGTDSEKAIAFYVQNNAFGMMRHEMMRLERMNANERFWFVNTVHDSLVFEPKEKDKEFCYEVVTKVMNAPCKVLADGATCPDGLVVKVDCQIGANWGELKEFKL